MRKKVQVNMLPTEDASAICKSIIGLHFTKNMKSNVNAFINQHLYFTSDEKIEEGDYVLQSNSEKTHSSVIKIENEMQKQFANDKNGSFIKRKIVVTTDFLEVSLGKPYRADMGVIINPRKQIPQIPESFIKQYVEAGGDISEVEIEYQSLCSSTGTECSSNLNVDCQHKCDEFIIKVDSNNCVIIHSIKDCWSKEEIEKIKLLAFEAGRGLTQDGWEEQDWEDYDNI